ncbi:hypothetical protein M432DRAFT_614707 [Thermoascus aurantiacus ATCC 26904]
MAFYLITESFLLQTLAAVISLLEEEERSSCISIFVCTVCAAWGKKRYGLIEDAPSPVQSLLSSPFYSFFNHASRFTVEFFILISNIRLLSAL